jgi:hypothetical protein
MYHRQQDQPRKRGYCMVLGVLMDIALANTAFTTVGGGCGLAVGLSIGTTLQRRAEGTDAQGLRRTHAPRALEPTMYGPLRGGRGG